MSVFTVTSGNFETEVLSSSLPVLVDFWAPWCAPCRMLSPVIAEFANEHQGSIKVCKINIDENPALAERYAVDTVPTVIIFKNGTATNRTVGYCPKTSLEALL